MIAALESMKVQFLVRFGWEKETRRLEAVRGFQATEADGVWHLHRSLVKIDDPHHRAIVFTHSLEEESHAEAFTHVYKQSSERAMQPLRYERTSLYSDAEPGWKSFAYVHVGEVDATERFRMIRRALGEGPLNAALEKIVSDEEGHIDLTHDILIEMGATEPEIQREVRRVRVARAWQNWLRIGQRVVDGIASLQLGLVYYVVGPFMFSSARRKLRASIVEYDNNQLKRASDAKPILKALPPTSERPLRVLGLSYGYHDSSATLVIDGKIVAAVAEERVTRQKHDANFPTYAIEACLNEAGITAEQLDQVIYHEDPHTKFSRVLTSSLAPFPGSRREFVNSVKTWVGRKLWSLNQIASRLRIGPEKLSYLGHHFSHAVQAFMGSGYSEAAILVVDAVGDWSSTAMFKGRWVNGIPQIERIVEIAFPHSIGLVYSAFTAYLGFNPNDSECSTMALAGFGEPVFAEQIGQIISDLDGDAYSVDQSYFNFSNFYQGAVTKRFIEQFGPGRDSRNKLPFSCLEGGGGLSADDKRFADIAASLQRVTEDRILALCERLHERSGCENLCYSGGVSLNCVANYRILSESSFTSVFIPPDPGDGGTSVGTALYYSALTGRMKPEDLCYGPYLGRRYDERPDVAMIDHIKPDYFIEYLKRGVQRKPGTTWSYETYEDDASLCAAVAEHLMDRRIVGWYQGGFEFGPRALGNRSILIRPDDLILAGHLSKNIKDRAPFRPYAFSVTEEDALSLLEIVPEHTRALRWMQYAVPVRPDAYDRVPAAMHVDKTTRVQVCHATDNPRYHRLLTHFGSLYGTSVLLNTSFNPSGYPIVSTPAEALSMFARTDMDMLVLNRTIIRENR